MSKKLVNSKATGIHGIPNRALKEWAENIAPSLTDIFNFSIETGVFPDDLKIGRVAPVYKSGEKDDLNNYGPISVLPTVARVFEKILYGQVYDCFISNKLLGNQQFGFRTLHSTALALSKCTSNWRLNMDRGDMTSVVFLDIRKAFDTMNHQILLDKMHCYGIRDGEFTVLQVLPTKSYPVLQYQWTHFGFAESDLWSCSRVYSWAIFIIYMNDLPAFVQEANITMYADDTSLDKAFRTSQELQEEMIPAFSKVCKWLRNNKLSLNTVETDFMVIGTLQRLNQLDPSPESTPYAIVADDGQEVTTVKIVKYLGMMVDDKLVWDQHVDYISSKITRNIDILKRIRRFISQESLLLLYHTLIEPYFRYCSIVWGQCGETLKDKLQILQHKAARTIAKLRCDEANHSDLLTKFG